MSRRSKGPRLWLRPTRRDAAGRITHESTWLILDGPRQIGTGCGPSEIAPAEKALGAYLGSKHTKAVTSNNRDPAAIAVDDVLALYARDIAPTHSDSKKTDSRLGFLEAYWSGKTLDKVTGPQCRAYAHQRGSDAAARRELEDLRAAINHHRKEGLHDRIVSVVIPDKSPPRERWMTREEAATLIRTTWRHQAEHGNGARHYSRRHVARFMVVARYMGSRASVIATANIEPKRPKTGPWIDLATGMFYGAGIGEKVTNKRKQKVLVPPELLAHLRRWKKNGQRFAVEWCGKPVQSVKGAHFEAVKDAGLDDKVTQHTWRHTVATWLLSEDVNINKVADFLAVDAKTLLRVYGHAIPSRTAEVHAAFRAHRQRIAKDKSEQKAILTNREMQETPVNTDAS